jgi:PPP family 3-phenylpropionic acid transporter
MPAATTPQNGSPQKGLPTQARQAGFYILLFIMTGANLPYMPLWMKAHGLTGEEMGAILAAPLLLRVATGPLSGVWADKFALYRTPLLLLSMAACGLYALLALPVFGVWRFVAYLVFYTCAYSCSSSIGPLHDAMTLQLSRSEGFNYALPRAIGSASFVVAEIIVGWILLTAPVDAVLIWVVSALAVMAIGGRLLLSNQPRQDPGHLREAGNTDNGLKRIRTLLGNRGLVVLLISGSCLQAAHSFYYAFSTVIWTGRGLSSAMCSYLWAVGVIAEIAFMTLSGPFRRKVGPWRMLLLAAAASLIRWSVMTTLPPLWALWPLQVLHAFTFAATFFAALDLVYKLAPKGYEGLAQTTNAAYSHGAMMGVGTLISGWAFERFGAHGYGAMLILALIGSCGTVWLFLNRERLVVS